MSGLPNPEGVKRLLEILDERAELLIEIAGLKPLVEEMHRKETRVANLNIEITKSLEGMDVEDKQRGNHGHENRVAALVSLLRDAARAEVKVAT